MSHVTHVPRSLRCCPTPGPSKSLISAETVLTFSWNKLSGLICNNMLDPLQDHRNLRFQLRRSLQFHRIDSLDLFTSVHLSYLSTINIFDFSWNGPYIFISWAIWNSLQEYTRPIPRPSKSLILAEKVLTFSQAELLEIVCKSTLDSFLGHQKHWF